MASNLVIEKDLSQTAQSVKDQNGNTSQLTLSTDAVGIGTMNPLTKLYIVDKAPADANNGQLGIAAPNGNLILLGRADYYGFVQSHNREPLALNPLGNNVGIGTTSPKGKLHVTGGPVAIDNSGDQVDVLWFGIERSWVFRQQGTGSGTALKLESHGGGGNKNFIIQTKGNVGIGTTSPQEKLDVDGNIKVTGDVKLSGADCAEEFDAQQDQALDPGTVMVIGDEDKLHQCTEAYDKRVAGVISGAGDYKPGVVLDKKSGRKNRKPVAMVGKVYCKADAQSTPIEVGDLLTTSSTPGHAMKAIEPLKAFGAVLGKALKPLKSGRGLIPILVALQ